MAIFGANSFVSARVYTTTSRALMSFDFSIFSKGVQSRVFSDSNTECTPLTPSKAADTLVAPASLPVWSGFNFATFTASPAMRQPPATILSSGMVDESATFEMKILIGLREAAPIPGFDFSTFSTAGYSVSEISRQLSTASATDTTAGKLGNTEEAELEHIDGQVEENFLSRVQPILSVTTFNFICFSFSMLFCSCANSGARERSRAALNSPPVARPWRRQT